MNLIYRRWLHSWARSRRYATVSSATIAQPPRPPSNVPSLLDTRVLAALKVAEPSQTALPDIIKQYLESLGHILDVSLLYEPCPPDNRRPSFSDRPASNPDIVMIAHCVQVGEVHKTTVSSGFALEAPAQRDGESIILTCAHTLEEIRQSPLLLRDSQPSSLTTSGTTRTSASGTFVISASEGSSSLHPVSAVLSALHRSDLLLLSTPMPSLRTLPVSPFPAQPQTPVRAHFVAHNCPDEPGWMPRVSGTWSKWVRGTVLGYRDFSGREAKPGTYDSLSHLLFTPLPTAGSSGGPIIDEESGAVVGVMLGTRMDNRVEGVRGWGVPSETIFEMFSLPGLEGKQ